MSELIRREGNDNGTVVCLIDRDIDRDYYEVYVDKDRSSESYNRKYAHLFEAYNFFYWALDNE